MEHLRELYDQIKERNHHGIKKSNQSERIIYALTANELRKKAGKRQLKVSTKDIRTMLDCGEKPMLKKIAEVYESAAFAECVRKASK